MKKTYLFLLMRLVFRFIKFRIIPDKLLIMYLYKKVFGKYPNLNNPKTFNEKMQWMKLNDRKAIYTTIADKYVVRKYVADKIGEEYLIPLLDVQSEAKNISFKKLPESFVVKPNPASSYLRIVRTKSEENEQEIIEECKLWLKDNYYYYGKEWQYKNIEPKIIFEELLLDENREIPLDYKFHCFSGVVEFIQVDIGRFKNHKRNFYDKDWNLLPVRLIFDNGKVNEKPDELTKMIFLARILAKEFNYIRVDFYYVQNRILFGELTLEPESGFGKWYPAIYDDVLGEKLII
jgi:hypothetical protein